MNQKFDGVIIDAGHGGIDSGAVGNNLQEKELNLRASKYMKKRLDELGIPSKMTREEDEYLPKDERIRKVLSLYNNSPNTILISNHINAGGGEGAEVVYALKNNSSLANKILNNIEEKGQIPRKIYQRRLPENPNLDYYYILRETGNTTPLLVEYGFIDNKNDSVKLNKNIEDYVEGVVQAIAEYLNYPYKPPQEEQAKDSYIVQKGDTLYSISKKMNIPIETIKKINKLDNNTLSIGQILYLNEKDNPEEEYYIVQKGDTLYSISKKFQMKIEELKELNNISSDTLQVGQVLIINGNKMPDNNQTYIVKKGDSLWGISKKYNIPINELIAINQLDDLTLQIGQELIVTPSEQDSYVVQKGDTLWSVAKKNGLSVEELKELNNLTTNLLSVGQKLITK
ncbi:MAG: LysM peptidoglycan-binding domain-containing protein [Bacilli bacterium]|nr:LysM peptidoglycan-binding domain-containing protein [Bacilli bacterium]